MSLRGRWDDVGTFLVQNSQLYIIIEHTSTLCYISGVKTQVEPKLKFFDNAALLHLNNPTYKKCVLELFNWLLFNDKVENDKTSKLLFAEKSLKKAKARIFPRQEIIVAYRERGHTTLRPLAQAARQPAAVDVLIKLRVEHPIQQPLVCEGE